MQSAGLGRRALLLIIHGTNIYVKKPTGFLLAFFVSRFTVFTF